MANPVEQYVWDLRYVDSPVVRFHDAGTDGTIDDTLYYTTDANFNVTAVLDENGNVAERYAYDPYGQVTVLNGSITGDDDTDSTSVLEWSPDSSGTGDGLKGDLVRQNLIIENRPIPSGFYQQMLVTDRYKLVAYMDTAEGELYDMQRDPNHYDNLWDKPEHQERKREMLIQLIAREPLKREVPAELADRSIEELLKALWEKMHVEEPVQPRTSFS